ncbi:YwbE family protein [Caproiciproducens galactitolivorans]|uniref:YwbE family protein n=1 Tax=Caproiciproducens galactitolivorans TaxID=642589 RepID=A0A4Z0YG58_9FIRM|nr:YwbE family protein [Caproiciproducens galactitolivorans]QEY34807.1 YwbE family protein [Caproiciproducens galactitolivorans]TGJ75942.1 hypothetical protein CAGA_19170 [Caproiciproducens galactitolivorans]
MKSGWNHGKTGDLWTENGERNLALVDIVLKKDQPTGRLTRGHVKRILTRCPSHPHGIKVMLAEGGQVSRVQQVLPEEGKGKE